MKNIHLFETKDAYKTAKSGLILPRVSYIKENKVVDYNPHYDYVEIAGIKWATMNIGAKSIYDYGLYFQWGDTQGYTSGQVGTSKEQKAFSWDNYKFTPDGNSINPTKYNTSDKKIVLDLEDDAVYANWGGSWRMPTKEEFLKLRDAVREGKVSSAFTANEGVNGLLLTDNADKTKKLFFPACGNANNGSMSKVGSYGSYWSRSLYADGILNAYTLYFENGYANYSIFARYLGLCVRGVLAEN